MDVNVRFRFNKVTGEVEVFEVDQEIVLGDGEHNLEHDLLAAKIGGLLEKAPRVIELPPEGGTGRVDETRDVEEETDEDDRLTRKD